jgi:hypothetical protein
MAQTFTSSSPDSSVQQALDRARAEFREMPGLRLTAAQARRLWSLDAGVCDAVLADLVALRVIRRTNGDAYVRNDG